MQAKLLQVLQDGEFARLGSNRDVRVDVRVVAATNRDLEQAAADGLFREDLLFRLNVVSITVPPLRQRRDEIPVLTEFFLRHYSEHYNKPMLALTPDTLRIFGEYDWPGNVRELENLMKRMVILDPTTPSAATSRTQSPADRRDRSAAFRLARSPTRLGRKPWRSLASAQTAAPAPPAPPTSPPRELPTGSLKEIARQAAREAEHDLIFKTLQLTRWNRREAAGRLGISYKALLLRIKEADAHRV